MEDVIEVVKVVRVATTSVELDNVDDALELVLDTSIDDVEVGDELELGLEVDEERDDNRVEVVSVTAAIVDNKLAVVLLLVLVRT